MKKVRSEQEIFSELGEVCTSPGYIHALAYICFRDNLIGFGKRLLVEDINEMFSAERLIRTEISTLMGLLATAEIDSSVPSDNEILSLVERSDDLLAEIHTAMTAPAWESLLSEMSSGKLPNASVLGSGAVLREAIFYAAESAYSFQYRQIAPEKYAADSDWLSEQRKFNIETAAQIADFLGDMVSAKATHLVQPFVGEKLRLWHCLPAFSFKVTEITEALGLSPELVQRVIDAFCFRAEERNSSFLSLDSFNVTNARPILSVGPDLYILLQPNTLYESLYESPFYWMSADDVYRPQAMTHRGLFTEKFSANRLVQVFGSPNVYLKVQIVDSHSNVAGEIDVLVLWGNRAILFQAKSKRLTLEARKGNDQQLRSDFKQSIQNSYDQAFSCAELLLKAKHRVLDASGSEILRARNAPSIIYPICVISDHYPALSFQARQFLRTKENTQILPPFVMDIFTLDVLCEMLESPLRFLSYVDRRATYDEKIHAGHELTILSFHLRRNLWLDDEYNMVMLQDDISSDLDLAMLVRRAGLPGNRQVDGILTKFAGTRVESLIKSIELSQNSRVVDFGFMMLTLSEDSLKAIDQGLGTILRLSQKDRNPHDFTLGVKGGSSGITLHASYEDNELAAAKLTGHCESRKYKQQATTWYGLSLHPDSGDIRFGLNLNSPHKYDQRLAEAAFRLKPPMRATFENGTLVKKKIGRNEPCPCQSGKKYKFCCLSA